MENLGKISGGNRNVYQTFVRIKSPESDIKIIENFVVLMYALCPHA